MTDRVASADRPADRPLGWGNVYASQRLRRR
jgi:hypothetical protein